MAQEYREGTTSELWWALPDRLGSVWQNYLQTRVANGVTYSNNGTHSYWYNAFGQSTFVVTVYAGGSMPFSREHRYQFTGREYDGATGLHYYRARWYDSKTGRFMSEDPMGFAAGDSNLYRYCGNNPINMTDPFGYSGDSGGGGSPGGWSGNSVSRGLWEGVVLLLKKDGYPIASLLLDQSLQDNPADVTFGQRNFVSTKIRKSPEYQSKKQEIIAKVQLGQKVSGSDLLTFNNGDLFRAFHQTTIKYDAFKNKNGNVTFHAHVLDRYDFDLQVRSYYTYKYNSVIATIGNNMAWSDQIFGVVNNYDIDVNVE